METDELRQSFLHYWRVLRTVDEIARLGGGEAKDVFRLDTPRGAYVLRIYGPEFSAADVASELELATPIAVQLDEVPGPIATADGRRFAVAGGRAAVLTKYVAGAAPDRADREQRRACAALLARLHAVGSAVERSLPRPGFPAWRDLDWQDNRWWSLPAVHRFLDADGDADTDAQRGRAAVDVREINARLDAEIAALPAVLAEIAALDLPKLPFQNDFWEGNIVMRNGRIAAIVDWDECMVDWRALDQINAACSFGRGALGYDMHPDGIHEFLDDYIAAGGTISPNERRAHVPLRAVRLLWETLYELGRGSRGNQVDWPYLWGNLRSFDGIDDI